MHYSRIAATCLLIFVMRKAADTEWERHEKLMAKAREILAQPIAEAIVSKDGTVTIKPTGWRFVDVVRMAQIAIELGMLAVSSTTKKGLATPLLNAASSTKGINAEQ